MLIEFCAKNNLFIANSNYKHRKSRLFTWNLDFWRANAELDRLCSYKKKKKTLENDDKRYI